MERVCLKVEGNINKFAKSEENYIEIFIENRIIFFSQMKSTDLEFASICLVNGLVWSCRIVLHIIKVE